MTGKAYLEAFLAPYWLRPETALWRAVDCLALEDVVFSPPILDFGCGDGLFSFLRAGGRLEAGHDVFQDTAHLGEFFDNTDIYDYAGGGDGQRIVAEPAAYRIDTGFDHKANLLTKAGRLDFYDRFVEGDGNQPLPFADTSFQTVFSNIVYWLDDHVGAMREIARILKPGGKAVLMLPNETLRDYMFYQRLYAGTNDPQWAWLSRIDRGRSADNIKMAKSYDSWAQDFAAAGLKVISHRQHLSRTLIEAWDIGLRPLSPVLIKMAGKLSKSDRLEIKREWIDCVLPLIEPLCTLDWVTDQDSPPAFHRFVLTAADAVTEA